MPAKVNAAEIRRAWLAIAIPGQVYEVRALGVSEPNYQRPHTVSGYFSDTEKLIKAIIQIAPFARGVYITLNPVNPALLARASNRIKIVGANESLTSDRDIPHRYWIFCDFDPVRPAGISSTDEEHAQSLERAYQVKDYLSTQGFPLPAIGDSGNGTHLLYFSDLPVDDQGLIQHFLETLALQFDDHSVKVDVSVYNPGRIIKVYGTVARKGDDTPERPHRLSRLLEIPDERLPVTEQMLQTFLASFPKPTPKLVLKDQSKKGTQFDLEAWMVEHGILFRPPKPWGDGVLYVLDECPFNSEHKNGSAFVIQHGSGAISAGCHHTSCQGKDWKVWREMVEPSGQKKGGKGHPEILQSTPKPSPKTKTTSPALQLLTLTLENALPFHTPEGVPYLKVQIQDRSEAFPIHSDTMREFLSRLVWQKSHFVPSAQILQDTQNILSAIAIYEGSELPVFIRLGRKNDRVYIDLGLQIIEIDAYGWQKIEYSPIVFRRPKNMRTLPFPQAGGRLDDLLGLCNLATSQDSRLLVTFLLTALQPDGPYPIMGLSGEQGTAKSTLSKLLKSVIDPTIPLMRGMPKNERDLFLAAQNNLILVFDNISHLPQWLSDALCRLSTGGGLGTRALYSNDEEIILNAQRPVILNGIPDIVTRPDLLDRAILLELAPIPARERRTEKQLWDEFSSLHPRILGVILDLVSAILRDRSQVALTEYPRMADAIAWASAAEPTLGWASGTVLADYQNNHRQGEGIALNASDVAHALISYLMDQLKIGKTNWRGTVSILLSELKRYVSAENDTLPRTPHHLSSELRRLAPSLRALGIQLDFGERAGHNRERILNIFFARGHAAAADTADAD